MLLLTGSRQTARDVAVSTAGNDPAGDCEKPVTISLKGLPDQIMVGLGLEKDQPAIATYDARCRKCPACLRHRSRLWAARARAELLLAPRSWFLTLTINPVERVRYQYKAELLCSRTRLEPLSCLKPQEQFAAIVRQVSPDITLMLKRIRKNSGARLRYLLVSEEHKDGFPHFHALIHEVSGSVTKRQIQSAWRSGFSQCKLVPCGDSKPAYYVSKYLSKSALTRVRASQSYGRSEHYLGASAEAIHELLGRMA